MNAFILFNIFLLKLFLWEEYVEESASAIPALAVPVLLLLAFWPLGTAANLWPWLPFTATDAFGASVRPAG